MRYLLALFLIIGFLAGFAIAREFPSEAYARGYEAGQTYTLEQF